MFQVKLSIEKKPKDISFEKDGLTGHYTRNCIDHFEKTLAKQFTHTGVFFIDVDNLKYTNDKFGHEAGDKLLIDIADFLKNQFRSSDIFIRYGGDEFIVLTPGCNPQYLEFLLNRLIVSSKERGNFSVGCVCWESSTCKLSEAINKADKLMYEQKFSKKYINSVIA